MSESTHLIVDPTDSSVTIIVNPAAYNAEIQTARQATQVAQATLTLSATVELKRGLLDTDRIKQAVGIAAPLCPSASEIASLHLQVRDDEQRRPCRPPIPTTPIACFSADEIRYAKQLILDLLKQYRHFLPQKKSTMALHVLRQRMEKICDSQESVKVTTALKKLVGQMIIILFMPLEEDPDLISQMPILRASLTEGLQKITIEFATLGLCCSDPKPLEEIFELFKACSVLALSERQFFAPVPGMASRFSKEDLARQLAEELRDICYILDELYRLYPDIKYHDPNRVFQRGFQQTRDSLGNYKTLAAQLLKPLTDPEALYKLAFSVFVKFNLKTSSLPVYSSCCDCILHATQSNSLEVLEPIRFMLNGLTIKMYDLTSRTLLFSLGLGVHPIHFSPSFIELMVQLREATEEHLNYFRQGEGAQLIAQLPIVRPDDPSLLAKVIYPLKNNKTNRKDWDDALSLFHESISVFRSPDSPQEAKHRLAVLCSERLHNHLAASAFEFQNACDIYEMTLLFAPCAAESPVEPQKTDESKLVQNDVEIESSINSTPESPKTPPLLTSDSPISMQDALSTPPHEAPAETAACAPDPIYKICFTLTERFLSFNAFRLECVRAMIDLLSCMMAAVVAPDSTSAAEAIAPPSEPESATAVKQSSKGKKKKRPQPTTHEKTLAVVKTEAPSLPIPEDPPAAAEAIPEDFTVSLISSPDLHSPARHERGIDLATTSVELCQKLAKQHPSAALHFHHAASCLALTHGLKGRAVTLHTTYGSIDSLRRGLEFLLHALRTIHTPEERSTDTHVLELIAHPLFKQPIPANLYRALTNSWTLIQTLSEANAALNYPFSTPHFFHPDLNNFLLSIGREIDESSLRKHERLLKAGMICVHNLLEATLSPSYTPQQLTMPRLTVGLSSAPPVVAGPACIESEEVLLQTAPEGLPIEMSLCWVKRWMTLFQTRPVKIADPVGEWTQRKDHWAQQSLLYLRRLEEVMQATDFTLFTPMDLLDLTRRLTKGMIVAALAHSGCPFNAFENNPRRLARLLPPAVGLPPKCMSWAHWVSHYPLDAKQAHLFAGELKFVMDEFQALLPMLHAIQATPDQDVYQIGGRRVKREAYEDRVRALVVQVHQKVCQPTLHYLHVLCRTAFLSE